MILISAIKLALRNMVMVLPDSPSVLGVRFVCCLLMHLQIEKKIRNGQSMMKYAANHVDKFSVPELAWLVGFLQCISTQATTFACIFFVSTISTPIDVIIKFIALATIAKFDNFYSNSLPLEINMKNRACNAAGNRVINVEKHRRDFAEKDDRSRCIRILNVLTKIFRIYYAAWIFYFVPLMVLIVPYFSEHL
jgi:hypothetical protein